MNIPAYKYKFKQIFKKMILLMNSANYYFVAVLT